MSVSTGQGRRRRSAARIGLNLTAMIDVVFLLLTYFMAATEFKLGEEIYRLDLPQRGSVFDLPREPLHIIVWSTGSGRSMIRLEGPAVPPVTDFDELYRLLRDNRRGDGLGGLFEPDHPIIIEPRGTAQWEHAMEAFNAAARSRYTNVSFAPPG